MELANDSRNKRRHGRHVIVVLPPGMGSNIGNKALRRWLSKGRTTCSQLPVEPLNRVLPLLHHEAVTDGLASLRFWGQTGEKSAAWMAGADPLHLETMLSDLRLHALHAGDLDVPELRTLFEYLQSSLGGNGQKGEFAFARIGSCGYLRGRDNLASAAVSAEVANGSAADRFMPTGAGSESYHRLLSEMQMSLHEHPVNNAREAAGKRAVNSLWIWGGGIAPDREVRPIPPLFSDDPLFRGYWESCTGVIEGWTGEFEHCLDLALSGFVTVLPDVQDETRSSVLHECLGQLRRLLKNGRINELTLLFRDGLSVQLRRYDYLKFWRGVSPLLSEPASGV